MIHDGIFLKKRSPCEQGLRIYRIEKGLVFHGTFKMHSTQVQLTGKMKVPGFSANRATSNICFKNIKDQKFCQISVGLLILTAI